MNRNDLHPVEVLLVAAVLVVWAVVTIARTVLVPIVALVLTVAGLPGPCRTVPTATVPAPPQAHPLQTLATAAGAHLAPLPVRELRRLARSAGLPRTLAHRGRRAALLEALGGQEVALI
jgi:hypothetical protein